MADSLFNYGQILKVRLVAKKGITEVPYICLRVKDRSQDHKTGEFMYLLADTNETWGEGAWFTEEFLKEVVSL